MKDILRLSHRRGETGENASRLGSFSHERPQHRGRLTSAKPQAKAAPPNRPANADPEGQSIFSISRGRQVLSSQGWSGPNRRSRVNQPLPGWATVRRMQSTACEILSCLDLGTMVSEGLCSEGGHSSGRLPEAS